MKTRNTTEDLKDGGTGLIELLVGKLKVLWLAVINPDDINAYFQSINTDNAYVCLLYTSDAADE